MQKNSPCFLKSVIERRSHIKEDTFRNLIRSTSFAVAQDESRPILMGVLFEVKNKVLNMVALDGFRLAMRSEYLESNEDVSVVIPGKNPQ